MNKTTDELAKSLVFRKQVPPEKAQEKAESFERGLQMFNKGLVVLGLALGVFVATLGVTIFVGLNALLVVFAALVFIIVALLGAFMVFAAGHEMSAEASTAAAQDLKGFGGIVGKLLQRFRGKNGGTG